jgi:MYXO-CTERM domain-containing protein
MIDRYRARGLTAVACAAAALMASARDARANGRIPQGNQLIVSPSDPTFLALEATFGILVSHDSGGSWGWICENAVGYSNDGEDPAIAMTQNGLMAATREGLSVTSDQGCSWHMALRQLVVDIAARRDGSRTALALASQLQSTSDGGDDLYATQVFATTDDGATWVPRGVPIDPLLQAETIEVAASDPHRIYVSGWKRRAGIEGGIVSGGFILVSSDDGASYAEHPIPLNTNEILSVPFIAAVDPQNANRVYVRVTGEGTMRIVASDDGAATFRTAYQGRGALAGFALSDDGSKIYIGGTVDGVLEAPAKTLQFIQKSSAQVTCLRTIGNVLYACMWDSNWVQLIGVSPDDGATFFPKFYIGCAASALSCPAQSAAAQCDAGVLASSGPCVAPDSAVPGSEAGVTQDAGRAAADAHAGSGGVGRPQPRQGKGGCGCRVGESAGAGGLPAIGLLLTFAARRRKQARANEAARPWVGQTNVRS